MLKLHSEYLKAEWLDAYGHMNEGYYLVAFSNATWALQDHLGVGPAYTQAEGNALYTVESHLRYLHEVRAPALLDIESAVFAFDRKRLHIGHVLSVEGRECATVECVLLHVRTETAKTHPFSQEQMDRIAAVCTAGVPAWCGSRVGLNRA